MKVGLFNDSFPPTIDGVANAVVNYGDVLTKKGCEVVVVTPNYPNVTDNFPYEVYRYPSIDISSGIPYRIGNPFMPKSLKDIKSKKLDIYHVHCPFSSMVFAHECNLMSKHKAPIILTYHTKFDIDIDRFVSKRPLSDIALKFLLQKVNIADEVWAVSKGTVDSLRKIGYEKEVRIMENGVDFEPGKSDYEEIRKFNEKYSLKPDETVLLYCGRTMWYKNIKIIADGLKILASSGHKFRMFFVGDGPDRPEIEKYIDSLGISDIVTFVGSVFERNLIKTFYSRANLFLFPSTYDTSGLVVKEAAACYCPSVLVEGSCAAEGVTDMKNGLLCSENAESFAEKIHVGITTEGLLEQLGEDAARNVYRSWNESVSEAYNRYGEILENWKMKK